MVRLINKDNIKYIQGLLYSILKFQSHFTYMREYNNPNISPCVYAIWHANQFCVHGIFDKKNSNVLISNSLDGEIVAYICEHWGFQVCRGSSQRRGAVSGTLKMIDKLRNGENIVITVDGPRGPLHTVKSGAIVLAREANVPIVPITWYSPDFTFVKFPSWDKMCCPIGPCRIMNIYGAPIYTDGKSDEEVSNMIRESLLELDKIAPQKFNEAKKVNS